MGIGFSHKNRKYNKAIFLNSHGLDDVHSVSLIENLFKKSKLERVDAGQILVKLETLNAYAPVQIARVKNNASSANEVVVNDATPFVEGDIVEITSSSNNKSEFRAVSAVNTVEGKLILAGDPVTASEGDLVKIDKSYGAAVLTEAASTKVLKVNDVSAFSKNTLIIINGNDYTVKSKDVDAMTITVDKNVTANLGAIVVPKKDPSVYKIAIETVELKDEENVLICTRDHGRVDESKLIGFDESLKTFFPHIIFDNFNDIPNA